MRQSISKFAFLLFFLPSVALAHTTVGETTGFMHGFSHPISGADHLLAMVAVGLWASQIDGQTLWAVPCTFVAVMILGGILAFSGIPVAFIEEGILSSVLIFGVLIAGAFKLPLAYSVLIVGFSLATTILHLAGISLGILLQKTNQQAVNCLTGGAIALSGVYLAMF